MASDPLLNCPKGLTVGRFRGVEVPARLENSRHIAVLARELRTCQSERTGTELPSLMNRGDTMNRANRYVVMCGMFGWLLFIPPNAAAEWFADLYGGMALGHSSSSQYQQFEPIAGSVERELRFPASRTFGFRGGYYSEAAPALGLAADVSYFRREADRAKIELVPLSVLVMLRYPFLTSTGFPKGRLQPYVGFGPSVYYSRASIDFAPLGSFKGSDFFDFGFDGRAGLAWHVQKHVVLFSEYRFTLAHLEGSKMRCRESPCNATFTRVSTVETTLATHHVLMGIGFRF